jgi:plasmid stabilization system protein ParE
VNSKSVVALEAVEGDLRAAISHYATWRSDAKSHLLEKYDETVSWIEWNPDLFPRKFGAVQRAIIKRSYYIVYFIQEAERTVVLAVLDGRTRPGQIRNLVKKRTPKAKGSSRRKTKPSRPNAD